MLFDWEHVVVSGNYIKFLSGLSISCKLNVASSVGL